VPDKSIVRFSVEQSSRLLRSLNVQTARASRFAGIEAVHDLRVAVRKFRQVLKILKPWLPDEESCLLRRELKDLMARAGDVRDRDIALQLLRAMHAPENAPRQRGIMTELHKARAASAHALHQNLRDFHVRNTGAAWMRALKLVKPASEPAASGAARKILPRMLKHYLRRGRRAARGDTPDEELHRFRIATKEMRYTLDLFAPLYGDGIGEITEQLKMVQTHLGSIHDCAVTRELVDDPPASAGKKDILRELEKRRARKTERFLRDYQSHFGDKEALRHWKKTLRRP